MVATNLKAETISLMDQRTSIEAQMNEIIDRLCQPGAPGISGALLDSEGFPRPDIDIPAIRMDRRRLLELRNDYKDITKKIDKNIQVLHSAKLSQNASFPFASSGTSVFHVGTSQDSLSKMDVDPIVTIPFAVVDEITEASPAAEDHLQLGDQIVRFGGVQSGGELLSRLASEAQVNQGKPVPIVVMRQGSLLNLTVTPRQWQGRGLLGCHFRIL